MGPGLNKAHLTNNDNGRDDGFRLLFQKVVLFLALPFCSSVSPLLSLTPQVSPVARMLGVSLAYFPPELNIHMVLISFRT